MAQSLAKICIHVIFSTKNRRRFLADAGIRTQLHSYLGSVLNRLGCRDILVGGTEDHVHILCVLPRGRALADVVREAKRLSSKWMKTTRRGASAFAWQAGYGAFSVSHSNLPRARNYVKSQEQHHKRTTFQDELRAFLEKHDVAFDERYIWD